MPDMQRSRLAGLAFALIAALPGTRGQAGSEAATDAAAAPQDAHDAQGIADRRIADHLAALLRAGREVISHAQPLINAPSAERERLTGATVLSKALTLFKEETGLDPSSLPADSREGRLLATEMQAIRAVIDDNQDSINAPDLGFKGFIPAVFSRLVSEEFSRRAVGLAEIKLTAPLELVRNRKSKPDAWETQVIETYLRKDTWPMGRAYQAVAEEGGRRVFRIAVPEYYTPTCLGCHGGPKGELDITGYPKEGAAAGALGGVISITLGSR